MSCCSICHAQLIQLATTLETFHLVSACLLGILINIILISTFQLFRAFTLSFRTFRRAVYKSCMQNWFKSSNNREEMEFGAVLKIFQLFYRTYWTLYLFMSTASAASIVDLNSLSVTALNFFLMKNVGFKAFEIRG